VPMTTRDIRAYKERSERFAMLTAYDAASARLLDEAGIPILLVGDSLGMVVLGHKNTLPVTMDDMLHHTAAVVRGVENALVVADMPFMSYQSSVADGITNAGRLLKEAGANAVKVEGGRRVVELTGRLVDSGIPVMGHLGLTPQSFNEFGGFRVQGKTQEAAHQIVQDAKDLEAAGAFSIVLEAVPQAVAGEVTANLNIPTIGIGAGPDCDAQVLVFHDFLGMTASDYVPRFVKTYASLGDEIKRAAREYAADVASGTFPAPEHTYG
jgi:3-methyl-2-oxobutanoate hydroxymethyltransferase